jgi:hypothetical protein
VPRAGAWAGLIFLSKSLDLEGACRFLVLGRLKTPQCWVHA